MKKIMIAAMFLGACGGEPVGVPEGASAVGSGGSTSIAASTAASSTGNGTTGVGRDVSTGTGGESGTSTGQGCQTCASLGKDCGPTADGCGNTLDCGACAVGLLCGGDGAPGVCGGCVPETCESADVHCGVLLDGCGNTLDCGDYDRDEICDNAHSPIYNCQCPADHAWGWDCTPMGNTSPPMSECIVNPNSPTRWCCTSAVLP